MIFAIIAGGFTALIILIFVYVLPMHYMHPLSSGKIEGTDIIAVKNRINNIFFIPSDGDWIAIDAGSNAETVKQEMERLSIDPNRVKAVFLTHTDYDHVASIVLFPHAVIYMSEKEKQMTDGSTYRQFLKKNKLPELGASSKIVYLSENEITESCKHKIRIIEACGHTKGSAMYAVDDKYLFTGDAFRIADGRILVHPYTMDKRKAEETIHHIKEEIKNYEVVFTAHYGFLK